VGGGPSDPPPHDIVEKADEAMAQQEQYLWDIWISDVGATGISFARGRTAVASSLLVHAAPQTFNVEVRDSAGRVIAKGENLVRTFDSPMTRLRIQNGSITREDIWPVESDNGSLVLLAGGEVGTLQRWWNDEDHQQWRWSLEFYNHR
jgi:hypothetical protein